MHAAYIIQFLASLTAVSALGINCRGSFNCGMGGGTSVQKLYDNIQRVDDSRWYNNGQQIACLNLGSSGDPTQHGICAFAQNTNGISGATAKSLAQAIIEHGCNNCGSAPLDARQNDVSKGQLTFNYVVSGCGSPQTSDQVTLC